jgi:hypothetical protein
MQTQGQPAMRSHRLSTQSQWLISIVADFNCDTSKAIKPEGMRTSRRKIDYSTAHEWATIIHPDDDGPAVADVCYPNFCSERESSVCGG